MWKLLLSVVLLLLSFGFGLPNGETDINEEYQEVLAKRLDDNELYDPFSMQLHAELEHITSHVMLFLGEAMINNETKKRIVYTPHRFERLWQRVAQENNATVDQLSKIFEFSSKIRKLGFKPEAEAEAYFKEAYREACNQYCEFKEKTNATITATTEDPGFLKSLLTAIFRPMGLALIFIHQTEAFINATTTAEKLKIFGNMCNIQIEFDIQ